MPEKKNNNAKKAPDINEEDGVQINIKKDENKSNTSIITVIRDGKSYNAKIYTLNEELIEEIEKDEVESIAN